MAQPTLFRELKKRRKEIDLIDQKLLTLLNQRLRHALEMGKIKKEIGEKVYDPKREKEVLGRLKLKNKGPLSEKDLKEIFKTVIRVCRGSQM
jgi:chorismate mutase/prephenate dehydratase